jgi:hypothetical protein
MKISTGSTLYFDANIFIGINPQKCNQLRQLTAAKKVKCSCPPRVLIELLSHINSDEKADFKRYQAAFRRQRKICSNCILPYSEDVLADYFGLDRPLRKVTPLEDFIEARDQIIDSKGYDELSQKILRVEEMVSGQEMPFENLWHDFRENYERKWVDIILSWANDVISSGDDEKTIKELYTLESKWSFLNMMRQIAGGKYVNELSASWVNEQLKPIEACFNALMKIFENSLKGEYGRTKLKNDWNDLVLLRYLGLEDHFFITDDKNLRDKVDDSCDQKKRILTFDEAIEKLKN